MTVLVGVVVGLLVVACFVAPTLAVRDLAGRLAAYTVLGLLVALGLVLVVSGGVTAPDTLLGRVLVVELFAIAVAGGGPVTATVLWLVDRGSRRTDMELAGQVLRGGAWIGGFERAAVFAALAAGWPEGLAVVLALKGLGRYSELRGGTTRPAEEAPSGGVAERFIIGTFASVLWGCAVAGAFLALTS
ncbi:MAG: hypothetical protein HOQ22_07205 [Nocardioidaceae bacterium]|nr:hypothetical protein [Nocardioidaceae bacterium]NUS50813.1 hypothetical protein [Nocardioidaceae bacterium]